jgi:hypothetical protein
MRSRERQSSSLELAIPPELQLGRFVEPLQKQRPGGLKPMTKSKILLAAALLAGSCTVAMAQAGGSGGSGGTGFEGPKPGDAKPPGALNQGGIPPAAAARRGDEMAPANTGGVAPIGKSATNKSMKHKKVSMKKKPKTDM